MSEEINRDRRHFLGTCQLFLATILASAIGAPIETLAEDKSVMQQMTLAAFRLPVEGELPSLGSARCDPATRHERGSSPELGPTHQDSVD